MHFNLESGSLRHFLKYHCIFFCSFFNLNGVEGRGNRSGAGDVGEVDFENLRFRAALGMVSALGLASSLILDKDPVAIP